MILSPCAINQIDVDAYTSNAALVCEYQVVASTVQLPVLFHFQQSRSGLVVSMETETTRKKSLMQLREFSELGPNWDGYGADSIDRVCVANVAMILAAD